MARNIAVGIDIGSRHVKVVVAEQDPAQPEEFPRIIGTGKAESKGLRHGYIVNNQDVTTAVKSAVSEASKAANVKIQRAFLAVGGVGLEAIIGTGSVVVSRGDNEITQLDMDKALENARQTLPQNTLLNRRVLHTVPLSYKIDGKEVLSKKPLTMRGMRLEVRCLFVTCLEQHLEDLLDAVEDAGITVEDVMAAPFAASLVSVTKSQKVAGCILANIGAETVSIIVFENGLPSSMEVFPIGSTDITNDIALGLRISLDEAERIKLGAVTSAGYSKKRLDEIMQARLSDIFDLIEAHLKKISRNGLLPAGIIITGGGSGLSTVEDLARAMLKLPSKIALVSSANQQGNRQMVKDASWSVAYGLCLWGFSGDNGSRPGGDFGSLMKKLGRAIGDTLRPFLP